MGSAFNGVNIIYKGKQLLTVAVIVLHGYFKNVVIIGLLKINNLNIDKNSQISVNQQKNSSESQLATKIITSNPKMNKSSSFYFGSLSTRFNESKNRLPLAPSKGSPDNKNKVKQETPLLTNLLMYSSAIAKITNTKSNEINK